MSDCLFCKIITGEIPAEVIYQDNEIIAFNDIDPQAPTHILVIPKQHISTINDIKAEEAVLIGKLYLTAQQLAKKYNINESGYRTIMNCNSDGGQAVYHIHLHLLGGRKLKWPPG